MLVTLSGPEYHALVEHSPMMIWRAGLDTACDYFNDTWLAYTGRTMQEELGDGWATGVHPDDLSRCVAYYVEHFHRRQAFEMEYRLRRHDGVYRWIFDRGVPFVDEQGNFAGFIGSCIDVDERVRAEAERKQRDERQLAGARDFEQWMVAIVSHDIRSPLSVIDMTARLLADRTTDPPFVGQCATRLTRNAKRIEGIVTDLLDVSRERQAGGIPILLAPMDLLETCQQVVEDARLVATRRTFTLTAEGDTRGDWDAHRLGQAVSNLVRNAVEHGAEDVPIALRLAAQDGHLVLEVANGGQIPAEILPHIFEPFRSGAQRTSQGGLGLGLFIVEAIARGHRGKVEVESTAERGTRFTLWLPRTPHG
jgi:PAS domain S-box-containing protein